MSLFSKTKSELLSRLASPLECRDPAWMVPCQTSFWHRSHAIIISNWLPFYLFLGFLNLIKQMFWRQWTKITVVLVVTRHGWCPAKQPSNISHQCEDVILGASTSILLWIPRLLRIVSFSSSTSRSMGEPGKASFCLCSFTAPATNLYFFWTQAPIGLD